MTIPPGRDQAPRMASYEEERARYRVDVPERFNAVLHIVERWAAEQPDALALLSLDGHGEVVDSLTVAQLARESRRAAQALLALGIEKGDPLFVVAFVGLHARHAAQIREIQLSVTPRG